jgi:hypothetical protein
MVPNDATKALKALDKSFFQGRVIHVLPGEVIIYLFSLFDLMWNIFLYNLKVF